MTPKELENENEKFFMCAIVMQNALKNLYKLDDAQTQEIHAALSYLMKSITSYADNLSRGLREVHGK